MSQRFNPNPSVLASLSEDQQQQLLAWMDLYQPADVLKMVAEPPPAGFGIETHPNSLKRFYAQRRAATVVDSADLSALLLSSKADTDSFDNATAVALRQIALELAHSPRIGAKQFRSLSRWVLKIRDQQHQKEVLQLAAKRLELDTQKFRFNAARQALIHFAEIGPIATTSDLDNEDKIAAVADLLFTQAPEPGPTDPGLNPLNSTPIQRGGNSGNSSKVPTAAAATTNQ